MATLSSIIVEINGNRMSVSGEVAGIIAYLAQYESFFNDKRTMGQFILICKDGHAVAKNEMSVAS